MMPKCVAYYYQAFMTCVLLNGPQNKTFASVSILVCLGSGLFVIIRPKLLSCILFTPVCLSSKAGYYLAVCHSCLNKCLHFGETTNKGKTMNTSQRVLSSSPKNVKTNILGKRMSPHY